MRPKLAWWVLAAVCLLFVWGIVELYDLRLGEGDIYPVYSSLRSDPLGAKVLFESTAALPGYSLERNYHDLDRVRASNTTILWLGEDPFFLALRPDADLKEFEELAARGNRLVLAMFPVKPRPSFANMQVKGSSLEKRWGVTFTYKPGPGPPASANPSAGDDDEIVPRETALIMTYAGHPESVIEKQFGKGSIVLLGDAYPFSNEALAARRDTELLAALLGPNRTIIFDEFHLGMSEESSIVMLARKYRLTGLACGLLLLAILFIWRNSSSLLPARRRAAVEIPLAAGRDSASALQNLLRRNISQSELIPTCIAEWERSRPARFSGDKLNAVRRLASTHKQRPALEVYRGLHSIITHKD